MGTDSGLFQTLNEAKTRLPIDDQWVIENMWSQYQGYIALDRAGRFSYGPYKKNRGTAV